MKKLAVVVGLAALVLLVVFTAKKAVASPEQTACARVGDLCGFDEDADKRADNLAQCTQNLAHARKVSGDAAVDRSIKCIDESTTCSAVAGCAIGGIGVGAAGEFMKGFGKALSGQ